MISLKYNFEINSIMKLIQKNKQSQYLKNIIHQDTQEHVHFFDLTVSKVYRFTEPASLDFGGSEFTPAGRDELIPDKKHEEDEYGWWHLSEGLYQAHMNESLTNLEDITCSLTPHKHTQKAGIVLNSGFLPDINAGDALLINFHVPEAGCSIKENARFASLQLYAV